MPAHLRAALPEDYKGIMALRTRNGMSEMPEKNWRYIHESNPFRNASGNELETGWTVEAEDGSVVGYLGNIPLVYELAGEPITTAAISNWIVDPEYRNFALLMTRKYLQQPDVDLFLNTTANENAANIFEAMRIARVPVEDCDSCLYWIAGARGFMESALRKLGAPFAKTLSYPGGLVLAAANWFTTRGLRSRSNGAAVQRITDIDERFDEFWRECRTENVLRLRRDSSALTWALTCARRGGRKAWMLATVEDGKISGFGIFLILENADIGLKRMRIMDFQVKHDDKTAAAAIIGEALKICRDEGVHVLEAIGFCPSKRANFVEFGARRRQLPNWRFYYKANTPSLAENLSVSGVWDPCNLDGDGCL